MMFIQNVGNPVILEIYAMTSGSSATVIFRAPWIQESIEYIIGPNQVALYRPPSFLSGTGSQFGFSGISVSSTSDVSVFGISSSSNTCGGFMVIPVDNLGTDYYAVTYQPDRALGSKYPQIGIVATEADTIVQITLPLTGNILVTYSDITYSNGQTITARINQFETIQIQEQNYNDLTGTHVTANKKVAVFSGNVLTDVTLFESITSDDHIVAQVPPTTSYGTSFGIVPIPDRSSNDVIKVVAREPNTRVTITGITDFDLLRAGDFAIRVISSVQPIYITSTKPILVAQFVGSGESNDQGAPSVVIVPPVEQYRNYYVLGVANDLSFENYLLLVVDYRQVVGIEVDGTLVPPTGWTNIPNSDLAVKSILLQSGGIRHYVRQANRDARFGAYIYGTSAGRCSYAYSAGSCGDDIYRVIQQTQNID